MRRAAANLNMTTWLNFSTSRAPRPLRAALLLALVSGCVGKDGLLTSHEASETDADDSGPKGSGGDTDATAPTGAATDTDDSGPASSATDTDDSGPTSAATDTDDGEPTGECTTGCEAEQFVCVRDLAWTGGLLGLSTREVEIEDCPGCDNIGQVVLLTIDPGTAAQTVFAEGQENSAGARMAVASDGSVFVAGSKYVPVDLRSTALLLKFSPDGELLWQIEPDFDPLTDLLLIDDTVVVADAGHDLIAFSAADGAPLWEVPRVFGHVRQIERDAEGALYVAGADPFPNDDALPSWSLRKYAADRTLLWEEVTTMTESDRPDIDGLALDEAGGAVLAVRNDQTVEPDAVSIHKLTADGSPVWEQPLAAIFPDVAPGHRVSEVIARPGGGVIVVGGVFLDDTALAFALDPDGAPLWEDVHQLDGFTYANHLAATFAADTLLVSGCGQPGTGDSVGWLFDPTP